MTDDTRKNMFADFSIQGDLAYLSHLETASMLQRAMVRAGLPVVYTKGFNPHPRFSLPLPRSVGVGSRCDRFVTQVFADIPDEEATRNLLNDQLPAGCSVYAVTFHNIGCKPQPVTVTYRMPLRSAVDTPALYRCIRDLKSRIKAKQPIQVMRKGKPSSRPRQIDVQPWIESVTYDDNSVEVRCRITPAGSVRTDELLVLLGLSRADLAESIERTSIHWITN